MCRVTENLLNGLVVQARTVPQLSSQRQRFSPISNWFTRCELQGPAVSAIRTEQRIVSAVDLALYTIQMQSNQSQAVRSTAYPNLPLRSSWDRLPYVVLLGNESSYVFLYTGS